MTLNQLTVRPPWLHGKNRQSADPSNGVPQTLSKTKTKVGALFVSLFTLLHVANATCPSGLDSSSAFWNGSTCSVIPADQSYSGSGTTTSSCGGATYSLQGEASCSTCPEGYNCASTLPAPCSTNLGDSYSASGVSGCTTRSGNTYVSDGRTTTDCTTVAGDFVAASGYQYVCHACPPGYDCASTPFAGTACSDGQYHLSGTTCTDCTSGNYCPSKTATSPSSCPTNTYGLGSGARVACTLCSYNQDCSSVSMNPGCPSNQWSRKGSAACENCPAGYDCDISASKPSPIPCGPGTYNDGSVLRCSACGIGKSCADPRSATESNCSAGTYSAGSQAFCLECPPGYSCAGNADKVQCNTSNGEWSEKGATTCTSYADGTEKTSVTTAAPQACPVGYYTASSGGTVCLICPQGYECDGTSKLTCTGECPEGTPSPAGACPAYQNCATPFTVCGVGKHLNGSGGCENCPAGKTCLLGVATETTVTTGYYSPDDETVEFICPAGKDCSNGSSAVDCADGYWSIEGVSACTICQTGYACWSKMLPLASQINCANVRGYYQHNSGQMECNVCEAGYECPYGTATRTVCDAGTWSLGAAEFCHVCPPGYACPSTDKPDITWCKTGTYSLGKQNACTTCEAGHECVGTVSQACAADKWSSEGDGICKFFLAGQSGYAATTHIAGVAQFEDCNDGEFSLWGTITCTTCPVGHYCPANRKTLLPKTCEPGTKQPSTGQLACVTCSAGTYSLFGAIECHPCPAGHECPSASQLPKKCESGYYAAAGATSCSACTAGYLCHSQSSTATPTASLVPYNVYATSSGQLTGTACTDGYYHNSRGASSAGACTQCGSTGHYCPKGTTEKFLCPPGHYCGSNVMVPTVCLAGTYSQTYGNTAQSSCGACPSGYYCPAGTTSPIKCPAGYVCGASSTTGTSAFCDPGKYSGGESIALATECQTCPKGHYCPSTSAAPSVFPIPCPAGKYNTNTGSVDLTACSDCASGRVCPNLGNQYGSEVSLPCLPGHPCPAGTATFYQYECPAGTYSDQQNGITDPTNTAQCLPCIAGFGCTAGTNTLTNPMQKCTAGYYCEASSTSVTMLACAPGTYSDREGLSASTQCYDCPPGKYCQGGQIAPDGDCYPGSYCPGNSQLTTVTIAASQTCTIDIADESVCACPAGTGLCVDGSSTGVQSATITKTGIQCPAGTYSIRSGMKAESECKICPLGSYCPLAQICTIGATCGASLTTICPLGASCFMGTHGYNSCPIGTYGEFDMLEGASGATRSCSTCPGGYVCASTGMTVPTPCGKGFYSADGATGLTTFICTTCPLGHFCEREDTSDTMKDANTCSAGYECPIGTKERPYYNHELQTSNANNVDNKYACPLGKWCSSGVSTDCLAGTYNPVYGADQISGCLTTPAGFYNDATTSSSFIDNKCPAGHFCVAGQDASQTNVCPNGTFRLTVQATQSSDCGACPSGYYCPEQSSEPMSCPKGYYCPVSSEFPLPCPIGTFGAGERLTDVTDCTTCYGGRFCSQYGLIAPDGNCDEGFYCVDKSMTPVPKTLFVREVGNVCEGGGYCPGTNKYPRACLPGKYQPLQGQLAETSCIDCPCGSYCNGEPNSSRTDLPDALEALKAIIPSPDVTGDCDAGYYCTGYDALGTTVSGASHPRQYLTPAGSQSAAGACTHTQCGEGFYQYEQGQDHCEECKERYYCPSVGMTYPTACPEGYYCEGKMGTGLVATPSNGQAAKPYVACPTGTFSPLKRLRYESECQDCTSGNYCTTTAITAVQGLCNAGYWCFIKATSATPSDGTASFGSTDSHTYSPQTQITINSVATTFGAGRPSPCPPGTYVTTNTQTAATECTATQAGYYSNTVVFSADYLSTSITYAQCTEGYYCPASSGSTVPANKQATHFDNICTAGQGCVTGSVAATGCSPGTYQFNKIQNGCIACPAGYFCDVPASITPANFKSNYQCPVGYFCLQGTTSSTQYPCPPGTYNWQKGAKTMNECIPAPPGYYIDQPAQSAVSLQCTGGYFCKLGSYTATPDSASTPTTLTVGVTTYNLLYSDVGGKCRDGYYCPAGTPIEIPCRPGYICDGTNNNGGTGYTIYSYQCPAGYYCTQGATNSLNKNVCPQGYYCILQSAEPIPCPAGTYGLNHPISAVTDCTDCTANYYCPNIGATSVQTGTHNCDAGFTCEAGSTHARTTVCPKGSKCPADTTATAVVCDWTVGEYQDAEGQISCNTVASGYELTDNLSQARCEPQNFGQSYYCAGGSVPSRVTCDAGKYTYQDRANSASDCLSCPAGYYCPVFPHATLSDVVSNKVIQCIAGEYCFGGVAAGTTCPEGFYCPAGTNVPLPCDVGNYCSGTGNSVVTGPCDAGYYCELTATDVATLGSVNFCMNQDSSLCVKGSIIATQNKCTAGHYCTQGSFRPKPCPIGTFSPASAISGTAYGLTLASECTACTDGSFCRSAGQTSATNTCEPGYYCDDDNSQTNANPFQYPCPVGNKCLPTSAFSGLTECPRGTYQPNEIQFTCYTCPAGYYCKDTSMTEPTICPVGYYCAQGVTYPTPCPAGKFGDLQGAVDDSGCQLGSYGKYYAAKSTSYTWTATDGTVLSTNVDPYTSEAEGTNCLANYKCYHSAIESVSATYGFITDTGTTPNSAVEARCAVNEICPTGTAVATLCPPGTYTSTEYPTDASACVSCPANYYCPEWGMVDQTNFDGVGELSVAELATLRYTNYRCIAGYVCIGAAIHPSKRDDITVRLCYTGNFCDFVTYGVAETACPMNYYTDIAGQSECIECPAGFKCEPTLSSGGAKVGVSTPVACATGSYCPAPVSDTTTAGTNAGAMLQAVSDASIIETTNLEAPCPAATYNTYEYAQSVSDCLDCPPGKYCVAGTILPQHLCAAGYICTGGQSEDSPARTLDFDFESYLPGNSGPCPAGHYCPTGSSYPVPCPEGTYQPTAGTSACLACPAQYYCATLGLTTTTAFCDAGYECLGGAVFAKPNDYITGKPCVAGYSCNDGLATKCAGGTYSPVPGASTCTQCPPGSFCNDPDGTSTPEDCTTTNYCPAGTETPISCPDGTYTEVYQTGLESFAQCGACPTGYYCTGGVWDRAKVCAAGYYCHSGASLINDEAMLCPRGFFCLEGSKLPTACSEGKISDLGATTSDDCYDCSAGKYCVIGIGSTLEEDCPIGHYCPDGVNIPKECPKGTYNGNTKQKSIDDCRDCVAGTNCDKNGISDQEAYYCPPGYFCANPSAEEEASNSKVYPKKKPCPAGSFMPEKGADTNGTISFSERFSENGKACYLCPAGYYCPSEATRTPEMCGPGKFCIEGSQYPKDCPPGYYCIASSSAPTPCPKGFYCKGSDEIMIKCQFGTYCEEKSSFETPCPSGTYGSGNVNNWDVDSACYSCGRGLYSTTDDPNVCHDCTEGYVCTGRTSSPTPLGTVRDGGYKCPLGNYCPLGSFEEKPCPVGTYGKYMGLESKDSCIKCKVGYYQDEPGQQGCKRCGPTSSSEGGTTSCGCVGYGRNFAKSIGACLCTKGFKAKNDADNVDSAEDCEADVKQVCGPEESITIDGECLKTAEDEEIYCNRYCQGGGQVLSGTGMCSCFEINDPTEICDLGCQKSNIQTSITSEGLVKTFDPVNNITGTAEPSLIPGVYGEFKAASPSGEKEANAIFLNFDDDITFDYKTNANFLEATQIEDNADTSNVIQKLFFGTEFFDDPWAQRNNPSRGVNRRRNLQDAAPDKKLFNPVLCITEGDAIFFNINKENKNYPIYAKDSILNTNPDFDYGNFEILADMINPLTQNITVTTFSHVFKQQGIFVFENSNSGTLTIISVVGAGQTCSNAVNGVSAAMVTKESLADIGVKSYDKQIVPNWWFIIGSFALINTLLYAVIGLFIYSYNLAQNQGRMSGSKQSSNTLYYDKLRDHDEEQGSKGLFPCCRKKKENKVDKEESDEVNKKHDFAVSYKDMEALLKEFHDCQDLLKKQLKDRERKKKRNGEEVDDEEQRQREPIEQLLKELADMVAFVNENNEVVNKVLEEELNEAAGGAKEADTAIKNEKDFFVPDALANMSKLKRQVTQLIESKVRKEDEYNKKVLQEIEDQQELAFHKELDKNDKMKNQILGSFKQRLNAGNLSQEEQASMMADLNAKMAQINDALEVEQDDQNKAIHDVLARRKAKQDKLRMVMEGISDKKDSEDTHYQKKLHEIQRAEDESKDRIEKELEQERAEGLETIEEEGKKIRDERLKAAEKKLSDFKKKGMGGDNEEQFSEMLANYGKLVEEVDGAMANWKQDQNNSLEEKLRLRREKKRQESDEHKKSLEQGLNKETQNQRSRFGDEMNQVQALLKPINDEQERLQMIAGDLQTSDAIKHVDTDASDLNVSVLTDNETQSQSQESARDGNEINQILRNLDKENAKKKAEITQARDAMKSKIAKCNDNDAEKQRLLDQLKGLEDNISGQMKGTTDDQNAKLMALLEARRNRRKKNNDKTAAQKQDKILSDFKNGAGAKVNMQLNLQKTQGIANRIQAGFEKDEQVQVSENFLDKKNKQELIDLMQSLFDERAGALRKFIFELMKQKQRDLQDLKEEYEPLREVLRQRQANNLISDDDYKNQMERLNKEEHDKRMDIEIEYSEKEGQINEELEKARIEAENEQKKVLKDRQTQEKLIMFNEMMKNMDKGDSMKQYLELQKRDAEKELELFRKKADKEKDKLINNIEVEKERKMQELMDRQDRMFNWEDKVKRDEDKIMEQFRKQKEEMMAKKLAEQQKEILRDMNKEDVDALLAKHKRQLLQMDEAMRREQERQMALMRANQKNKNADLAKEKMLKQIKLAEIQKKKVTDAARARELQVHDNQTDPVDELKNDKLEMLVEKVNIMSQLIFKASYSRPIQYKRHIMNQHKLNEFLGRNLLLEKDGDMEDDEFSLSNESFMVKAASKQRITYSELLERIAKAEKNYEQARTNQMAGNKEDLASRGSYGMMTGSRSAFNL